MRKFLLIFTSICFSVLILSGCYNASTQAVKDDFTNQPMTVLFKETYKTDKELEAEKVKIGPDVKTSYETRNLMHNSISKIVKNILNDDFYIPVTESFVDKHVATESQLFLSKGSFVYKPQSWDCDDYSLTAIIIARREYFSFEGNRPVSILFGEFHYIIDGSKKAHSVNCFITPENKLKFFDPINGKIINLTESEIKSCIFWRF